jgi:hypothetical protein
MSRLRVYLLYHGGQSKTVAFETDQFIRAEISGCRQSRVVPIHYSRDSLHTIYEDDHVNEK